MKSAVFAVLIALAVLAAAACQNSPTGPSLSSVTPAKSSSTVVGPGPATAITAADLLGTWRATKAEAWRSVDKGSGFVEVPGSRRDLVAEGAAVTLAFQPNSESVGAVVPEGKYVISVVKPGTAAGVDSGFFHIWPGWREIDGVDCQVDFYPARLLPDAEYGELPGFLVALSGNTLKLWDGGMSFLPYDLGWPLGETGLAFEFIRK